jgi:single-strand DNA-binding protein
MEDGSGMLEMSKRGDLRNRGIKLLKQHLLNFIYWRFIMSDQNLLVCSGGVVTNPELKKIGEHEKATFRLIVNNRKRKVYIEVEAWNKTARFADKYLKKGKRIIVTGRLEMETYNSDTKYFISANNIEFPEDDGLFNFAKENNLSWAEAKDAISTYSKSAPQEQKESAPQTKEEKELF